MSKPFETLIEKMPVDRQNRIRRKTKQIKKQLALVDLRPDLDVIKKQVKDPGKTNKAVWKTI